MTTGKLLFIGASVVTSCFLWACRRQSTEPAQVGIVRLAELEIDPAQLESYRIALKEEITDSIRIEPGVLMLNAVSVKGHPSRIRLFEKYSDDAAYRVHLNTSHFKKYKTSTRGMIKSLTLIETDPILLGAKTK